MNLEVDLIARYLEPPRFAGRRGGARPMRSASPVPKRPRSARARPDGSAPHGAERIEAVEKALRAVRAGKMVVVVDDEDPENEGDFVMAAERCTPEHVNFMTREARGLLCVSMEAERLEALGLGLMAPLNTARFATPFTVSVDPPPGTTSGSSAHDRAATIRALVAPRTRPEELARPGHVFPLRATGGGVLQRPGHTEAALDLARLAGMKPAGVLCEILSADGRMARGPELVRLAKRHGMPLLTIRDLIRTAIFARGSSSGSPPRSCRRASGASASWSTRAAWTDITTWLS